jgi:hypothetical protein
LLPLICGKNAILQMPLAPLSENAYALQITLQQEAHMSEALYETHNGLADLSAVSVMTRCDMGRVNKLDADGRERLRQRQLQELCAAYAGAQR